jgi:hypothetical protein
LRCRVVVKRKDDLQLQFGRIVDYHKFPILFGSSYDESHLLECDFASELRLG